MGVNPWIVEVREERRMEVTKSLKELSFFLIDLVMGNAGLDEAQAGIKIVGEISITSDM